VVEVALIAGCAVAFVLIPILLLESLGFCLRCVANLKLEKLRGLNAEVNQLVQDDDHWRSCLEELSALDETGRREWIDRMRLET
jgi:hypothetical protein